MESQEMRIMYAGYADRVEGRDNSWKVIPDSEAARKQALEDGYTAFSTTSFSYEPADGRPEPIRHGPLILDIDYKLDPEVAVNFTRDLVLGTLLGTYGVNPYSLKYWISGGKGCHVEIPAEIFGAEGGHPYLPLIYKEMVKFIMRTWSERDCAKILDLQMYNMGKGRLLRCENIKRANGRYKVPVTYDELMKYDAKHLLAMADTPRLDFPVVADPPERSSAMEQLYSSVLSIRNILSRRRGARLGLDSLLDCGFIAHCWNNRQALSEPEWWAMVKILMGFGPEAKPIVHFFSQGYSNYSEKETEDKIRHCERQSNDLPCSYLKELHNCGKNCNVGSPRYLWMRQQAIISQAASAFSLEEDGVYYGADKESSVAGQFICSPLKILGKLRTPESLEWSRLVEVKAPDGVEKKIIINMRDCVGRGDTVRALLADNGVEFSNAPKAQSLFMEYLQANAPAGQLFLRFSKVGWQGDAYVLPDQLLGSPFDEEIYFESNLTSLHQVSGSLDEWKDHVGKYCRDNSLLVLLTSYALTGPLLRPCGFEGGGIHIFGSSSAGKSTAAHVAGSVCGGGGHKGFMRQWNSTHNAIENTAVLHDDNLLVLDEIGQASAETIAQIPYMLANGQGKARMKSDASARNIGNWLLNFLSTGELTINDKIQETGKYTVHVGQQVRVIDLPIDAGIGQDLYQNKHGYDDGARLSDDLGNSCQKYYGSPLRAFLTAFCGSNPSEKMQNVALICEKAQKFVDKNSPEGASGQVRRVCRKFALIASAGEFAIGCGIFPYEKEDVWKSAAHWFKIWLSQRDCIWDLETYKGLRIIQDHFELESEQRYVPICYAKTDTRMRKAGYSWEDSSGGKRYLMLSAVANEILRGVNRKALLDELSKRGWIELKDDGTIRETKSIDGTNYRGLIFKPSAWEEKVDQESTLSVEALSLDRDDFY